MWQTPHRPDVASRTTEILRTVRPHTQPALTLGRTAPPLTGLLSTSATRRTCFRQAPSSPVWWLITQKSLAVRTMQGMFSTTRTRVLTAPQLLLVAVLALSAQCAAQQDVCGRSCSSDVQCPDTRGVCTYCTKDVCQPAPTTCGDLPSNGKTSKSQLLVVRALHSRPCKTF